MTSFTNFFSRDRDTRIAFVENDRFAVTRIKSRIHSNREGIRARFSLEGCSHKRETRSLLEVKFTKNGTVVKSEARYRYLKN